MTHFITVPETTLPDGSVVQSFRIGQFVCSKGDDGKATSTPTGMPWDSISYHEARKACADISGALITERQWLAIAHDVVKQDCNWTGGKIGKGKLFQGICNWNVNSAQPGDFEPTNKTERRWLTLSNGERICDMNGNVYQWVFDDVQGDENGIPAKAFTCDSVSLMTPYQSMEKGIGWLPSAHDDWSCRALMRSGCYGSGVVAGAFYLDRICSTCKNKIIGFRCTKAF